MNFFFQNTEQMPEQIVKSLLNDKPNLKQTQLQKVTPLSKTKIIQPLMSENRIHTPSHAQNLLNVRLVFNSIWNYTKIFIIYTHRHYIHFTYILIHIF